MVPASQSGAWFPNHAGPLPHPAHFLSRQYSLITNNYENCVYSQTVACLSASQHSAALEQRRMHGGDTSILCLCANPTLEALST